MLFALWIPFYGQGLKDTLCLKEIDITNYRSWSSAQNFSQVKLDSSSLSQFQAQCLQTVLLQQNYCLVKAYGPGNIADLSVRGSSASQTAVLWNGLNINNAMLGSADISLLPVNFFNQISLQKGALSGYWGSGAMAGVLDLRSGSPSEKNTEIQYSTSYSTLQNLVQSLNFQTTKGRWDFNTRAFAELSQNKYNYFQNDSVIAKQTHASVKHFALLQDVSFRLDPKQAIGLHLWLQDAQRQVPYGSAGIPQNASQEDKRFRVIADWHKARDKFLLSAKTAFFNEGLDYTNTTYAVQSNSMFQTFIADLEATLNLKKGFRISGGSSNYYTFGTSSGYDGTKSISRNAIFENLEWSFRKFTASAFGREEVFNQSVFVPTGGMTASLGIFNWLQWKSNAGTVYRYPTLNDLYWNPGGNQNLKPESGYSFESSLLINKSFHNFSLAASGTVFSRDVHNWILWLPGMNGIWSPSNIMEVWSRGSESLIEISFRKKKFNQSLKLTTNYVLSTPVATRIVNDQSVNRQIPYVPMYSGSGIYTLGYGLWAIRIAAVYTGYRYLSSDDYNYLLPYWVWNTTLSRTFSIGKILFNGFIEGNNLLNENYQSVSQFSMPLRNYRLGITLNFQKPKVIATGSEK